VIDRATDIRVRAELERAVCTLLASSDGLFYAHVLIRMGRQVSDDVDTMAVTMDRGRVALLVNPRFWDSLADRPHAREGVLIHEVLHVVLRHLERSLSIPDRETFNIAADLAVNEIVGAHRLPEGAYLIENMPEDLGLSRGATAEAHYDRMKQAEREGKRRPGGASGADSAGRGNHTLWPVDGGADGAPSGSAPHVSPSDVRVSTNELVNAAARETLQAHGRIPGELARAIEAAKPRRARTDWRSVLRIFGASGTVTHLKPTIMSESKRFGTVPGVRVRQKQSLAVVIDTSGSIGDAEVEAFFSEIHGIWRLGVDVTVIECDAEIPEGGVWKYKGSMRRQPEGGGGTDFDPAISFANGKPFDGVVYLTDGYGGRTVPCRWRMLWMLTTDPKDFDVAGRPWRPREAVCQLKLTAD